MSMDDVMKEKIQEAVDSALSANLGGKRYIDITRVPLICQSIIGIHTEIKELKTNLDKKYVTRDSFFPVKIIVYGIVGIVMTAALGRLLALIFAAI